MLCLFFSVCYKLHKESNLLDATRIQQVHVLTSQTNFSQMFYVLTVVKTSRISTHHNINFTKALHSKSFRSKKLYLEQNGGTLLLYTSSFNRQITVTTLVNLHEYEIEFGPIAFWYVTYFKQECVSAVQFFFLPILGPFCHVNLPPNTKNDWHYTG